MAYRTILVYLGNEARAAGIINVAAKVAQQSDNTHLIGLYVLPGILVYPGMAMHATSGLNDTHRQRHMDQAKKIRKLFDEVVAREGISAEWRVDETDAVQVAGAVAEQGRCSDLVVIGQQEEDALTFEQQDLAGRLLLEGGRPVLLVPHSGTFETTGDNVLVAWNASRESARAVSDALPVLTQARKVSVLCINPPRSGAEDREILGTQIAATLARHGVTAEVVPDFASDISVGDEMLSRASDLGCDLIVMGAYGHSRFREMVFGGATRHVLNHMTVPVLMSH